MDFRKEMQYIFEEQEKGEVEYLFDFEFYNFVNDFIIPKKKHIPRLFRYTPADYNNIRCLEKECLFLSEAGRMNDIFEGLSCETQSDDKTLKAIDENHDLAYIKSFTENECDLVMWGTYADNYAGMCVEYDCSGFIDETLYYHLLPVYYTEYRNTKANPIGIASDLLGLRRAIQDGNVPDDVEFLKDIMGLFVSKSKQWRSEKEWRLIVTYLQMHTKGEYRDDDESEDLYRIDTQLIPFPYVKSIYLGPRMQSNVREHLVEIGNKLNVPVYRTKLDARKYALVSELEENSNARH